MTMTDLPISFTADMAAALWEGRKTQGEAQ